MFLKTQKPAVWRGFHFKAIRLLAVILTWVASNAYAQDDDTLAEFARKAQNPLGDVKALMTDNTIAFDGGHDAQLKFAISYYFNRSNFGPDTR